MLGVGASLLTAERGWPAFPAYDVNLDFGPIAAGGKLSQSIQAPPTPLLAVAVYAVGQVPAGVGMELFDADSAAPRLLAELRGKTDDAGRIRFELPRTIDTSGRRLMLQFVIPEGPGSLTLQANHTDPYADGIAAAHGDPGDGRVDIRLDTWRRMTPAAVGREVAAHSLLGAGFAALTVVAGIGVLRVQLRSWGLAVAIVALDLRLGFELLAPWMG